MTERPARGSRRARPGRHRAPRRAIPAVAALLAAAGLLLAAVALLPRSAPEPAGVSVGRHIVAARPDAPTSIRIPRITVDSPLETLDLAPDRTLTPPKDYQRAGWYAGGAAPGETGPAVIAGHVDSRTGPAVFARLGTLAPGDRIEVHGPRGIVRFTVTQVRRYDKDAFPTAAVYGPTTDPQLRLITCAGPFDRAAHSYRDNLVVFAAADPVFT
ncbi:class F sortase [Longispora urticae]